MMKTKTSFILEIYCYITKKPLSLIFLEYWDKMLIFLYLLNIFLFYINFFIILTKDINFAILNMWEGWENDLKDLWDNSELKNNFEKNYIDDENHKEDKKYALPDKKFIYRDWDKLSPKEQDERKCIENLLKSSNHDEFKKNMMFMQNTGDAYFTLSVMQKAIKQKSPDSWYVKPIINLYKDPHLLEKSITGAGFAKKGLVGISYAVASEASYKYNEYYYGIERPENRITKMFNDASPYRDATYVYDDTWNDKIKTQDVKNYYYLNSYDAVKPKDLRENCNIF
jgi:hypothetical protein